MKKYFFLAGFFVLIFLAGINFTSAQTCVLGPFNATYFCNVSGEFEPIKPDFSECLEDFECEGNSCVYGKKTLCVNTSINVDCSDWNNDEFGCIGETDCGWNISATEEFYCEAEYAAIKERGNFLQIFLQKIIDLFTQVFQRTPQPTLAVGILLYPTGVQAVYDEGLNQINLTWNKVSVIKYALTGGVIRSIPTEREVPGGITGEVITGKVTHPICRGTFTGDCSSYRNYLGGTPTYGCVDAPPVCATASSCSTYWNNNLGRNVVDCACVLVKDCDALTKSQCGQTLNTGVMGCWLSFEDWDVDIGKCLGTIDSCTDFSYNDCPVDIIGCVQETCSGTVGIGTYCSNFVSENACNMYSGQCEWISGQGCKPKTGAPSPRDCYDNSGTFGSAYNLCTSSGMYNSFSAYCTPKRCKTGDSVVNYNCEQFDDDQANCEVFDGLDCTWVGICGNGNIEVGEECDDGKSCSDGTACTLDSECAGTDICLPIPVDGDGCSALCEVETGWDCIGNNPSACDRGEETENVSGYNIYRSTASGLGFLLQGMPLGDSGYDLLTTADPASDCVSNACGIIDSDNLQEGVTYHYIVTAVLDSDESNYSNETSATVPDNTPPTISFISPTTTETPIGQSHDQNYIVANVSASDNVGIDEIVLKIYDESYLEKDFQSSTSSPFYYSFSLPNGVYYLNATVSDRWGNINNTERRINLSLIDLEIPKIAFVDPTTEEGKHYQNYILANVSATDDKRIETITIYLYNSAGLYKEETRTAQPPSTPFFNFQNFTSLPYGTYYLNATVIDIVGKLNITETREINVSSIPEGEAAPIIEFLEKPEEGIIYYPDSEMPVKIKIIDNAPGITWALSSNVSGIVEEGYSDLAQIEKTINLKEHLISENSIDTHKITFQAIDSIGLTSSDSFILTIKNENCTDAKDNDGDDVIDDLDKDCALEVGKTVSITNLISDPEIFTYRTMDIDCDYETESEYNVRGCVKLNVSGIECNPLTIVDNVVRFRGCEVGGEEKEDAEIKCYVSDECNSQTPTENTSLFNITKFSICEDGDVGEENLKLRLLNPIDNSPSFDTGEEINFELEVENRNPDYAFDIVVEAWLYDVFNEKKIANATSDAIEIIRSQVSEDIFVLNLTVPSMEFSENNRLYYKAYEAGKERSICVSDSVRLYLEEEGCVDADGDGYCEENDCDDTNSSINPGEFEICTDNIDNDCDDLIDSDDLECTPSTGNEIPAGQSEDLGILTRSGKQRVMNLDSRADFNIVVAGEQHSATVKNVTSSSVTLTISSSPFDIFLIVGQTKAVDVDDDSIDDLAVTLNGIENGKVDLTFRNIFVAARGDDTIELGDEEEKGRGIGWFIFIFVL
ncbi:MAG: MopE-related protein, partial [Patescibacteria group bacterium]|nr:MopE-related protein [Patescibacteria group bacterium]